MQEILRFAMLGLGLGALYSLASQGLMVIYRGSGVLNFAHGAIGMVGAYIHWEVKIQHGNPAWVAWIAALTGCAIIGALAHLLVMRQLKRAAPLARIVATLGLLVILQSAAVIRYGARGEPVKSELPRDIVHPFGGGAVSIDRFLLLGIATAMSVLLWALYRYTKFGLATTAVAENQRAASSLGLSPDFIASANWALGSALAGMAAILISPLIQLQVSVLTNVVLAAMAAALVASFRSFPIALLAGVAIGIGQSELTRYVSNPGWATSLPFLVIIGWMVLRGQALPLRDFFLQRLPAVGSGKVHPGTLAGAFVLTSILILSVPAKWQDGFVVTFSMGLVLLSVVVVTGYAGQLSLAQFALAGFGALIAGRLVDAAGWPFPAALLAAVVATVPLGALFALPAVRARGINLAIVTLGLGTALEFLVRRGRSGRRLLAVRTNERAAAALGISVIEAKVYAFALSAGIAAIGGTLMAFRKDVIIYKSEFLSFNSILVVAWSFIGGIGYLFGPLTGATLASGALGAQISNALFSGITKWIQLIGGVILVLLVILNQDGLAREQIKQIQFFGAKVRRFIPRLPKAKPDSFVLPASTPPEKREKIQPKTLEVRGLTVKYGAVIAVDDLSLTVQPGQIVGLIGPNGAGKTSAIDAITGFTKMAAGRVHLEGVDLSRTSPIKRSRAGLSRSFQTLELFEDASVLDNLRAASDPRDRWSYLTDLVNPKAPPLPDPVVDAIHEFQLEDDLLRIVQDLPYGQRRLLAIARAVATEPGVLLLDEPAAGLGDHETAELAHLVRRLADDWGIAVLLVEHDMNFVMSTCDHIVVLDFGRQISEGSPEEVRSDPKVIAAYLGEHEKDDDDHDDDHDDESELRSIAGGQE